MSDSFTALMISKTDDGQTVDFAEIGRNDLMEGDVTVRVQHSTMNYKDGLAITGKAPVVRRWPMVPGIDLAGTVEDSSNPDFKAGDKVVLTGWGLGETHWGGYAAYARVKGEWLVPLPDGLGTDQAMAIGTAGFTAMLAVLALEDHGVKPDGGDVLVTGAAGGVGSVATALLAKLGYRVIASTGRPDEGDYLKGLGAQEIVARQELSEPGKPLGKERWAAAVDVAGSHTLANVLAQTAYGGTVAACGLAQGMDLPVTVAPFILRGVTLAGIDSVYAPRPRRVEAWGRLSRDLDKGKLEAMTSHAPLSEAIELAPKILAGQVRGRIVIDVA